MAQVIGTPGDDRDPDLVGTADADSISGLAGDDVLRGLGGSDQLNGDDDNDVLSGGAGEDDLFGGDGNDKLFGGAANGDPTDGDRLEGGLGVDELTGGSGLDFFFFGDGPVTSPAPVYDSGVGSGNRDRIIDFSRAESDRIDVGSIDADTTVDDDQTFNFVGEADIGTLGAGEIGFFETGGGTVLHANTDADPGSTFEIQLDGTELGLSADDFIL
jgi:Ca2+-binding RTX toxin-like protein